MHPPDPSTAVAEVLNALRGTSIFEIEVRWDDGRVRVARDPVRARERPGMDLPTITPDAMTVVLSAYVGVYHRPDGKPLPQVGEAVTVGQTLAEVETLTIHNPVSATSDGVLVQAFAEDGMPVEYGQPLFVIDTAPGEP